MANGKRVPRKGEAKGERRAAGHVRWEAWLTADENKLAESLRGDLSKSDLLRAALHEFAKAKNRGAKAKAPAVP